MVTIWFFDADPIGAAPERVYMGPRSTAMQALQARFGWDLFPDYGSFDDELRKMGVGFVWELPSDSSIVVLKH